MEDPGIEGNELLYVLTAEDIRLSLDEIGEATRDTICVLCVEEPRIASVALHVWLSLLRNPCCKSCSKELQNHIRIYELHAKFRKETRENILSLTKAATDRWLDERELEISKGHRDIFKRRFYNFVTVIVTCELTSTDLLTQLHRYAKSAKEKYDARCERVFQLIRDGRITISADDPRFKEGYMAVFIDQARGRDMRYDRTSFRLCFERKLDMILGQEPHKWVVGVHALQTLVTYHRDGIMNLYAIECYRKLLQGSVRSEIACQMERRNQVLEYEEQLLLPCLLHRFLCTFDPRVVVSFIENPAMGNQWNISEAPRAAEFACLMPPDATTLPDLSQAQVFMSHDEAMVKRAQEDQILQQLEQPLCVSSLNISSRSIPPLDTYDITTEGEQWHPSGAVFDLEHVDLINPVSQQSVQYMYLPG